MTSTDVQYSEDGNYWWDGSQWQPVDHSQGGGGQAPSSSSGESQTPESQSHEGGGQQGGEQPIDWTKFPTLWTIASSSDVNDHYQKIGIDPSSLMAGGSEGSEHESEGTA